MPAVSAAIRPLQVHEKAAVALRAWRWLAVISLAVRRRPLPELAERLARVGTPHSPLPPVRLGRGVARSLRVGPLRPRCLLTSLVLYRLLREQGDPAQLVIGLPPSPRGTHAHAWVEVDGEVVSAAPGRGQHRELVRYGTPDRPLSE